MTAGRAGSIAPQLTWRLTGVVLIALAILPIYAWLLGAETGLAGDSTVAMASEATAITTSGMLVALAAAFMAARFLKPRHVDRCVTLLRAILMRLSGPVFALTIALLAACAAMLVQSGIFHRQPVLIDAIAQITHARYWAAGLAAAPADTIGFFRILHAAPLTGDWVSQYPPMHPLVLAVFARANAMWLAGPFMLATAMYFTARAADELKPGAAAPRAALAAAAVSPFVLAHAATYMSHTTAAAFIAIALYSAARAMRGGNARWLIACGIAAGCVFATRPLTGLVVGAVLTIAVASRARSLRSAALMFAGALPFAVIVALYNQHYFGAPTRFGYDVALGPSAGLGFGIDPWGNRYGIAQAFGYTSAELATLSLQLFEVPLPLVAITGLHLLLTPVVTASDRVLTALAVVPLAAGLLYWHHGLFMGPRMLNEYALVWAIVCASAFAELLNRAPATLTLAQTHGSTMLAAYSPRSFVFGVLVVSAFGMLLLAPRRLASFAVAPSSAFAATASAGHGLVFIHGGWTDRVAMQLAARGWRLDVVETALRQNSTCSVQRVVAGTLDKSALSLEPRNVNLPARIELTPANAFRYVKGEPWPAECAAQVRADRAGVMDPTALLWRGSLPGVPSPGPSFARDLGPELNALLVDRGTAAHVLMRDPSGTPVLVSYDEGMRRLWKESP